MLQALVMVNGESTGRHMICLCKDAAIVTADDGASVCVCVQAKKIVDGADDAYSMQKHQFIR